MPTVTLADLDRAEQAARAMLAEYGPWAPQCQAALDHEARLAEQFTATPDGDERMQKAAQAWAAATEADSYAARVTPFRPAPAPETEPEAG